MASCVSQGQAGCLGVPQPHHLAHSLPSAISEEPEDREVSPHDFPRSLQLQS